MKLNKQKILFIAVIFFWFAQYVYIPYQTPYLAVIQTSTSFIGIIIGAFSSGCVSLFRIIFNNGIVFLIENLFSRFARAISFFQAGYVL